MEKSIFELAVEELLERQHLTKVELKKRFKGVKPFRMEKIPDEERIKSYYDFLDNPDVEQQLRMDVGDAEVEKYHFDMRGLINRRMMQNA